MASLVNVSDANILGNQINFAINQIRDGLAFFGKYDGLRDQTIAVDAATFGKTFGINAEEEAQAFSDRWAAISNEDLSGLADFVNSTVRNP